MGEDTKGSESSETKENESIETKTEVEMFGFDKLGEEETKEEKKTEEKKETKEEGDQLERSYSDVARRDRELKEREEKLRENEKLIRTYTSLKEKAASDPLAVLRELEIDPMRIGNEILGVEEEKEEPKIDQTINEIKKQNEQLQNQIYQMQFNQMQIQEVAQIKAAIKANPENYTFLAHLMENDSTIAEKIFQERINIYNQTQKIPDYKEILDNAEKTAENNIYAALESLQNIGKVKEKFGAFVAEKKKNDSKQKEQEKESSNTLSQEMKGDFSTEEKELTDEQKEQYFKKVIGQSWKEAREKEKEEKFKF